MDKESGKVPNEINRSEPKHLDKRALCTRSDERHDGQDSDDQASTSIQIGMEVKLPGIEETAEKVKTESCDDGQIETEREKKDDIKTGEPYELGRQNSNHQDTLPPIPDGIQVIQNTDDVSEQHFSEDFKISLYNETNCKESIHNHPNDYTENYITGQSGLQITEIIDHYDGPNKLEVMCCGRTITILSSCFNEQYKEKYLYTAINFFFKRDNFEIYDKCRPVYDKFCYNANNLNWDLTVCPMLYESSSESESENEPMRPDNEMQRQGNESPGIEEATFGSGNGVLNQENGVSRQETGASGLESNASRLENEGSRQDNDSNLMQNHNIPVYQSDFGNIICHPTVTDEIELADRSLSDVQTEQLHYITQNHMVVSLDSRSRTESNLGQTLVTTESSVATSNAPVLTSGSSRELFYWSSQESDRTRVPQLPSLFQDFLDEHMPNTRGAAWHTHSFKDLPILMANPAGAGFQATCPLDPGLMILLYQIKTNSGLWPIFTSSTHSIFNEELPALLNVFCDRKFEEMRQKWSDIIQWRGNSFYSCDGKVMMPPFDRLLHFIYSYKCTSTTCPTNNRILCMPDTNISLSCPAGAFLDYRTIQHLIDRFQHEEMSPCGEPIHHTRPDTIDVSPVVNSYYQTDKNSQCYGTCTTERRVDTSVEQPPVIVLNMARSCLTRDQIGDLNDTVQIGGINYYIGGVTFAGNNHFTARILLPHLNMQLFYDNLHGIRVIQENQLEPDFACLSLLFLFRKE